MRVLGDWLVPHLNGEVYSEKPPLFFWLSALGQAAGLGVHAGRIVAGLSSLGTLLFTFALARRFLGDRAGFLSALVLGTSGLIQWIGRFGVIDPLLTFCVTAAVYGLCTGRAWLFFTAMAFGVLAKGPVATVLCILAAAAWMLSGQRGPMRQLWWGFPLKTAIVVAWLWPACVRGGPSYTDAILWKQNVGRAVESWSHARPFWYYVPYLLGLFLPWTLFLPWAAPWSWRQKGFLRAMLLWAAMGFVLFSAISGKRERYLMPLFPALAIVVGAWLDGATSALSDRWVRIAARVLTAICLGVAAAVLIVLVWVSWPPTTPAVLAAAALVAVLIPVARRGIRARREGDLPRVAAFAALGMAIAMVGYDILLVPRLNEVKSPRPVALELNRWPGEVAAYPAHFSGAYNLYSGRLNIPVLDRPEEVAAHLAGPGKRLVLTSQEHYERPNGRSLKELLGGRYAATPIGQVGHRDMLFLTNYPPPPP